MAGSIPADQSAKASRRKKDGATALGLDTRHRAQRHVFYTGTKFAPWRGNIFIGAMAGRNLTRLVVQDGRVVVEERLMIARLAASA